MYISEPNPLDVETATRWLLTQGFQPTEAFSVAAAALHEAHPRRLTHGASGYRKGQCRCAACKAGERLHVATRGYRGIRCGTPGGFNKHLDKGENPCLICQVAMEASVEAENAKPGLKEPQQYEQCGKPSGYTKHHRMGERTCPACKEAREEYRNTRRARKREVEADPVVA